MTGWQESVWRVGSAVISTLLPPCGLGCCLVSARQWFRWAMRQEWAPVSAHGRNPLCTRPNGLHRMPVRSNWHPTHFSTKDISNRCFLPHNKKVRLSVFRRGGLFYSTGHERLFHIQTKNKSSSIAFDSCILFPRGNPAPDVPFGLVQVKYLLDLCIDRGVDFL